MLTAKLRHCDRKIGGPSDVAPNLNGRERHVFIFGMFCWVMLPWLATEGGEASH